MYWVRIYGWHYFFLFFCKNIEFNQIIWKKWFEKMFSSILYMPIGNSLFLLSENSCVMWNTSTHESVVGMFFCSTFRFNVWLINIHHIFVCTHGKHGKTIEFISQRVQISSRSKCTKLYVQESTDRARTATRLHYAHFYLFFAGTNSCRLTCIISFSSHFHSIFRVCVEH